MGHDYWRQFPSGMVRHSPWSTPFLQCWSSGQWHISMASNAHRSSTFGAQNVSQFGSLLLVVTRRTHPMMVKSSSLLSPSQKTTHLTRPPLHSKHVFLIPILATMAIYVWTFWRKSGRLPWLFPMVCRFHTVVSLDIGWRFTLLVLLSICSLLSLSWGLISVLLIMYHHTALGQAM